MYQRRYHSTEATDTGARERSHGSRQRREGPSAERERCGVDQPTRAPSNGRSKPASAPPGTDAKASPPSRTTPSPTWQRRSSSGTRRTEVSAADDETGDVTLLSTARHHLNRTRTASREDLTRMPGTAAYQHRVLPRPGQRRCGSRRAAATQRPEGQPPPASRARDQEMVRSACSSPRWRPPKGRCSSAASTTTSPR